jgi:hypothetical protein
LVIDCMARLTHLIEQAEPTLPTVIEQDDLLTQVEPS